MRKINKLIVSIAVLSFVSLSVLGCGESSPQSTTATAPTGPPLFKRQYEAKINEIFAQQRAAYAAALTQVETDENGYPVASELTAEFYNSLAPIYQESVDQLRVINPPEDVADLHETLIQNQARVASALENSKGGTINPIFADDQTEAELLAKFNARKYFIARQK